MSQQVFPPSQQVFHGESAGLSRRVSRSRGGQRHLSLLQQQEVPLLWERGKSLFVRPAESEVSRLSGPEHILATEYFDRVAALVSNPSKSSLIVLSLILTMPLLTEVLSTEEHFR